MSAPTQLNITVTTGYGSGASTSTITLPIPSGLAALDSGNTFGGGQSTTQTGFSSIDTLIRSIYKAGGFFSGSTWYAASTILSITWQ